MLQYKAPLDDMRFLFHEIVDMTPLLILYELGGMNIPVVNTVLNAAAPFCEKILFPLNQSGDMEGCRFSNGKVQTPQGTTSAYQAFRAGGWPGLSAKKEYGGQGLPLALNCALDEMVSGANMAFSVYSVLARAAYNTLEKHGNDAVKETYLPRLVSGQWLASMCISEPQCGTDIGLIETKVEAQPDGTYVISGEKIFISAGEHDLSDNIVYLVLARLPDALPGIRGLSLFVVPKHFPMSGGRNNVFCTRLENKMGLNASPTCTMHFENAIGRLVGKEGEGAKAMFTMMNEARLAIGLQGIGIGEACYQNAASYAKARLQMRAITGAKCPSKPADPLIVHPDVRLKLLRMKALTEGCRALAFWTGSELDIAERHPNEQRRAKAADFVALMTPVLKAFGSDIGFECANAALQIYGGRGYMRETGIEQYVRDSRVAQIYEGTNAIQALDLVMRKMAEEHGRMLRTFFHPVAEFLKAEKDNGALAPYLPHFASAFKKLQMASLYIATRGVADPNEAGAGSSDYLRMFGLVAVGFMWLKIAKRVSEKLLAPGTNAGFYQTKLKTANFYLSRVLPEINGVYRQILSGAKPVMDMASESF